MAKIHELKKETFKTFSVKFIKIFVILIILYIIKINLSMEFTLSYIFQSDKTFPLNIQDTLFKIFFYIIFICVGISTIIILILYIFAAIDIFFTFIKIKIINKLDLEGGYKKCSNNFSKRIKNHLDK